MFLKRSMSMNRTESVPADWELRIAAVNCSATSARFGSPVSASVLAWRSSSRCMRALARTVKPTRAVTAAASATTDAVRIQRSVSETGSVSESATTGTASARVVTTSRPAKGRLRSAGRRSTSVRTDGWTNAADAAKRDTT